MFDINLYTYTYTYVYICIYIYTHMHIIMINEPNNNESKIQNTPTLGPLAHHGKHVLRQRCDEGIHRSHSGDGQQSQLLAHISSFLDSYELNTGNLTVCYYIGKHGKTSTNKTEIVHSKLFNYRSVNKNILPNVAVRCSHG